jgi:hypothetical protein
VHCAFDVVMAMAGDVSDESLSASGSLANAEFGGVCWAEAVVLQPGEPEAALA